MSTVWSEQLGADEKRILKLCKKQPMWGFLRKHRHLLFDERITAALEAMYAGPTKQGRPPRDVRQQAMAMLLQVVCHASDQEVPTLSAVDRRWQMVLGWMGQDTPLLSQGTVFNFRARAMSTGFMSLLLEHTVALARERKGFSHKRLRALIDSSPLLGAGRVEDSFNLIGRAISQVAVTAASNLGVELNEVATQSEVGLLNASSVKAWLDIDWSDSTARSEALTRLLEEFAKLQAWLDQAMGADKVGQPPIADDIERVRKLIAQDTEPDPQDPEGKLRILDGVPEGRQISISDPDMRHGRKSKSKAFNGYKRHLLMDADIPGLIVTTTLVPANATEHGPLAGLLQRAEATGAELVEVHVDRGYIPSDDLMKRRRAGLKVFSKAPTVRNGDLFTKLEFDIDIEAGTITCPGEVTVPIKRTKTGTTTFPKRTCASCPLRAKCTTSKAKGRTIRVHRDEDFHQELRAKAATAEGRQLARQRIPVEHGQARIRQVQGVRARYLGTDKNAFDLDRSAVIANCYVLNRILEDAA